VVLSTHQLKLQTGTRNYNFHNCFIQSVCILTHDLVDQDCGWTNRQSLCVIGHLVEVTHLVVERYNGRVTQRKDTQILLVMSEIPSKTLTVECSMIMTGPSTSMLASDEYTNVSRSAHVPKEVGEHEIPKCTLLHPFNSVSLVIIV
jgi:hypothetical protein